MKSTNDKDYTFIEKSIQNFLSEHGFYKNVSNQMSKVKICHF